MIDTIIQGDCLEVMPSIPDKSVDMILCDLPYGTTACKWDQVIPFEPLWKEYKRLIKDHGAIVLTASQPFTSFLITSNIEMFKCELIWEKSLPTNVFNAKKMFMKWHENILIFYDGLPTFNPQMTVGKPYYKKGYSQDRSSGVFGRTGEKDGYEWFNDGSRYPSTIMKISNPNNNSLHPTQKPVALFEYLIKTYTNEGDLVLDNCIGSGTTAIAARNTKRHFIGIEKEPKYVEIATKRLSQLPQTLTECLIKIAV
jgi:site-specific DNA-methyltransferase (adenine-specific)